MIRNGRIHYDETKKKDTQLPPYHGYIAIAITTQEQIECRDQQWSNTLIMKQKKSGPDRVQSHHLGTKIHTQNSVSAYNRQSRAALQSLTHHSQHNKNANTNLARSNDTSLSRKNAGNPLNTPQSNLTPYSSSHTPDIQLLEPPQPAS